MEVIIYEQGNGLPTVGEYVSNSDGLYYVESIDSRVQTDSPKGNYVYATVDEVDWSECEEENEFPALVELVP